MKPKKAKPRQIERDFQSLNDVNNSTINLKKVDYIEKYGEKHCTGYNYYLKFYCKDNSTRILIYSDMNNRNTDFNEIVKLIKNI